jgi:hypothetical protein
LLALHRYRNDELWSRDWGLMVWVLMNLVGQGQCIARIGSAAYSRNFINLVEILANLTSLVGLVLSMCHRREVVDVQFILFGAESCWDNQGPATA